MPLTTGARLGPYEILSLLGAGGMGEVYRAHDTRLDRDVAVKVLPPAFAADLDRRARFEREAKAVAALSHPNILAIFDTGLHQEQLFVVTELLDGESLRAVLERGALSIRKAIDIGVQIARGLAAAHDKAIVHRDIKPENVFLLKDGQVKILDFGLARAAVPATAATATVGVLTDPGMVMGSAGYMAPEQVRGQETDARTDLFALGAVLYEMLSGRRAFAGDTAADTMFAVVKEDPPELTTTRADLSPALDRIVRHCLEKNPTERFQTARDVAFALEAFSGSRVSAPSGEPKTELGPAIMQPPSKRLVAAVALMVVIGALAFAGGRWSSRLPPTAQTTFKRLTFDEGFVFAARFAPDGRQIVYSANGTDSRRVSSLPAWTVPSRGSWPTTPTFWAFRRTTSWRFFKTRPSG